MDTQIISSYAQHLKALHVQRARVACLLGFFLFPATLILEFSMYPAYLREFLALRLFCSTVLLIVYLFSFTGRGKEHGLFLGIFAILFMASILSIMIFRLGYETPYYAGLNLVILAIGVLFTWEFRHVLLVSISIYLMYLIPILAFQEITNYPIFQNNNLFIIETIIIASVSNYFVAKLRFRDFESRYQLSNAVKQLSELDQAKTSFFSNVSHELRTPLTLILAPTQSALKEDVNVINPKKYMERLKIIHSNGLRLLSLINNLLDVVRANIGKMKLDYSRKDLVLLIKNVMTHLEPLAEKKKIKLEFDSNLSSLEIDMDQENLEKVLVNLIQNALKFTPEGGFVKIGCQDKESEVEVVVEDNGIGISEEAKEKIFEPFYQGDSGSKRVYEGSGIGLGLCRQIVQLHKGKIGVESQLGKGSKFIFTLPKKSDETADSPKQTKTEHDWSKEISKIAMYEGAENMVSKGETQNSNEKSGLISASVLIVEDNVQMKEYLRLELSKGFDVSCASNGKEAWERIQRELPDLVVSDVMMPEMDGYELCKNIKENQKTRHIPVLLVTAKGEISMRLTGYEKGADDYVVKPFNVEELIAKSRALIQARRSERELEMYRRLASIGEIAAGVAHELRNALNASIASNRHLRKLSSQFLDRPEKLKQFFEEAKDDIQILSNGMQRAQQVVNSLLTFSKKDAEGFRDQDIHEGIESTLQILNSDLINKGITIHKEFANDGNIYCDLNQLNQVFFNLIKNSYDAVPDNGEIWIRTWRNDLAFFISIRDNGSGISKEHVNRVFDPFFTTKPVGKGTGLGLSISYNIVRDHRGKIKCHSKVGQGTEFVIELPTAKSEVNHEQHNK